MTSLSEVNNDDATPNGGSDVLGIDTDEELFKVYGKVKEKESTIRDRVTSQLKSIFSCSGSKAKRVVNSVIPITKWLPRYKIRENLLGDVTAGITVGVVHLPQGMAYALLASLPAVVGLYVSFIPVLMYAIFGTTRHLSIGTFAVVSLMIGTAIDKHVPESYCDDVTILSTTASTMTSSSAPVNDSVTHPDDVMTSCHEEYEQRKMAIAIALSIAVGLIHLAMYILRLGIVTIYLSSYMVSGFTCGAAFQVMTSQVPKLLGLDIPRKSGILSVIYTYIDVFKKITTINWATVIVSLCCILPLVIGKEINLKFKERLPFPIPWELAVVIFTTVASQYGYLNLNHDVSVVGDIPQGIRLSVPSGPDIGLVMVDAIPMAIVIYSISISLSRMFSEKHAYNFDPNQELLAYACANIVGAFFFCYPSGSSLSRSIIWEETGGNTQITGFISSAVILVILLWIGPLFETLPEAALAAIIVVNLKRMLQKFEELKPLWKVSKLDAITWFVSWLAVILLGVDLGLGVGVGFCLATVIFKTQVVSGNTMVPVGDTGVYRSSKKYIGENDNDSVVIFKFPTPLIYANQERFKSQISMVLGFKPAFEIARRKKLKLKAMKMKKKELKLSVSESVVVNEGFIEEIQEDKINGNVTNGKHALENGVAKGAKPDSSDVENKKTNKQETKKVVTHIILDMSACPFVDNDGVKTIKSLHDSLAQLDIKLLLAESTDDVRQCLHSGNFPPKSESSGNSDPTFFISVKKAVCFADRDVINDDVINEDADAPAPSDEVTRV